MAKRILIWNQHWWTLGGGERYNAMLACLLSEYGNEVVIAGCEEDPREAIRLRLGINISGVNHLAISDSRQIVPILNGYDVFINGSYLSDIVPPPEIQSVSICFFPQVFQPRKRWIRKSKSKLFGMNHVRKYPQASLTWLGEEPTIAKGVNPLTVEVLSGSISVAGTHQIEITAGQQLKLEGNTWQRISPNLNQRTVYRVSGLDRASVRSVIEDRFIRSFGPVHNYDAVWAISDFTNKWVKHRWNLESELLYPPVATVSIVEEIRDPYRIISVGRFFSPDQGHCKNQHLIVEAFRKLTSNSKLPWKLVLVGSVSGADQSYLDDVRKRAQGLNVEILVGITGEQLDHEYAKSSFYWHATGLGRSFSEPEAHEHFGITLVEAMARGIIPIVYDSAGPKEILNDWPQLRFSNIKELVTCQNNLISQDLDLLRSEMLTASELFSTKSFGLRAANLLSKLVEK